MYTTNCVIHQLGTLSYAYRVLCHYSYFMVNLLVQYIYNLLVQYIYNLLVQYVYTTYYTLLYPRPQDTILQYTLQVKHAHRPLIETFYGLYVLLQVSQPMVGYKGAYMGFLKGHRLYTYYGVGGHGCVALFAPIDPRDGFGMLWTLWCIGGICLCRSRYWTHQDSEVLDSLGQHIKVRDPYTIVEGGKLDSISRWMLMCYTVVSIPVSHQETGG